MPREAGLFEAANGSVVNGYYLIRKGGANIPPMWIERAKASRKKREKELGELLKAKSIDAVALLKEWDIAYQKECFYHGIRVLLELERKGKAKY
ncbi:MAG: hypothetical protein HZA00_01095 [Nitrospinae bacterium]|nr:hypothetical protein [Nitrospinota bacterium]